MKKIKIFKPTTKRRTNNVFYYTMRNHLTNKLYIFLK